MNEILSGPKLDLVLDVHMYKELVGHRLCHMQLGVHYINGQETPVFVTGPFISRRC